MALRNYEELEREERELRTEWSQLVRSLTHEDYIHRTLRFLRKEELGRRISEINRVLSAAD